MNLAKKLLMTTGEAAGGNIPSGGYVDDVFSTYLYTGNGSSQTINNGIDLAGEGGLVWIKNRVVNNHQLMDTLRGTGNYLCTNNTAAQGNENTISTFNSNGFTLGNSTNSNRSGDAIVSWTFRKAPKFFDVVTYTGDGTINRQIPHSLGVAPGMVIIKATNTLQGNTYDSWRVWHRSLGAGLALYLDKTNPSQSDWMNGQPTSTTFPASFNLSGVAYVAYLFAHDPSAEGIIQCGSFTGNTTVNIGWEPQWIMIKRTDDAGDWIVIDSMRGCSVGGVDAVLNPNLANAEFVNNNHIDFTATGFITKSLAVTGTYIYAVIRRPNKSPTTGTQVFSPETGNSSSPQTSLALGGGSAGDLWIIAGGRSSPTTPQWLWADRLRGLSSTTGFPILDSSAAGAEASRITSPYLYRSATDSRIYFIPGTGNMTYKFSRAPGFMDVVCDTGTGAAHAIAHNLTKAPELIIRKSRSAATQWEVWHSALTATEKLVLNSSAAKATDAAAWNSTLPTATQFTVGTGANVNANAATFVTYLFATLAGISKIGSYNGNGGTQTIPCGFTTGSRFVLIKRIDNTGDWFVWDTARGITPTTDPHLSLNTTAAEVTTDDSIDQDASGFIVNQNAATNINALGGNYLFLAIA